MKTTHLLLALGLVASGINASYAQEVSEKKELKRRNGTTSDFRFDLGMSTLIENNEFSGTTNKPYAVRPFGSWYVDLNQTYDTKLTGPLHLEWGGGVSWYNFKFEEDALRIDEGPEQVSFTVTSGDDHYNKSKLTASFINLKVVPMLKFKEKGACQGYSGFRIGAGVYGGYKIDSYTKYVVNNETTRDHDNFYLNNMHYGARLQAGYRGMDIFVNYDISNLFLDDRGPELNALSFGIIL